MAVKSTITKVIVTITSISKVISGITLITKARDANSAEMSVIPTAVSVTSLTNARKSTSTLASIT